ncbi:MAG: hypothetical protein QNJ47_10415 [Nostocaceae cyanobacterium]|nr:hypothetical protein [Nostocaceae cyanobacterium]
MAKTPLISSIITSTLLISTFFTWGVKVAQAKRPISLLNARCVNSGIGSVREKKSDISIGKAVYTSRFSFGPGYRSAAMTCKIKPDKSPLPIFQTLNLGFGMRDNDTRSPSVEVNIYVDGQQVETRTVAPTQRANLSVNVSNASNIAIEAICSSQTQYCNRVYFFDADLEQ